MNGKNDDNALEQRRKYVQAFNATMIQIWKERIQLLGVIDTGQLLSSLNGLQVVENSEGKFLDFSLSQQFLEYGIWQDYGTGREVSVNNDGDIGRDKVRKAKKWFNPKYFSSFLNLRDFISDNIGQEALNIISNALDDKALKASTEFYKRRYPHIFENK